MLTSVESVGSVSCFLSAQQPPRQGAELINFWKTLLHFLHYRGGAHAISRAFATISARGAVLRGLYAHGLHALSGSSANLRMTEHNTPSDYDVTQEDEIPF